MMSPVFEYPPLLSGGFCDIAESDFERLFVAPFSSTTRKELCVKFREWLQAVRTIPIPLELWIDGSFVTYKPDPSDIDLVCVLNEADVLALSPEDGTQLKELLRTSANKTKYGCHVFPMLREDIGRYNYWINLFGRSRSGVPKGMFRIFIGVKT